MFGCEGVVGVVDGGLDGLGHLEQRREELAGVVIHAKGAGDVGSDEAFAFVGADDEGAVDVRVGLACGIFVDGGPEDGLVVAEVLPDDGGDGGSAELGDGGLTIFRRHQATFRRNR